MPSTAKGKMALAMMLLVSLASLEEISAIPAPRDNDADQGNGAPSTLNGDPPGGKNPSGLKPVVPAAAAAPRGDCSFGGSSTDPQVGLCEWSNLNISAFQWRASKGQDSFWIGGPDKDRNENSEKGGYAFFETSQLPNSPMAQNTVSAMLASPILNSTGSQGFCVGFSFSMNGLSADRLRLLLQPIRPILSASNANAAEDNVNVVDISASANASSSNNNNGPTSLPQMASDGGGSSKRRRNNKETMFDARENVVLATLQDSTRGGWSDAQVMYSYPEDHRAIPKDEGDQARSFRGFIAVDDVSFRSGEKCGGHCNFDAGFCQFEHAQEGTDFQWKVGRGSDNPNTGPIRDHSSFTSNRVTGAFAYIDASAPRRPNDAAQMLSQEFPATEANSPLCLRFWTHMYGSGVGDLNVYVRGSKLGEQKRIWSLSGDAGNVWYEAQASVASNTPFKIVFEAVVGRNSLGNIAIDDVSIVPGVCPTSPQVASPGGGDCAFEDDTCGWSNPEGRETLDEINWERVEGRDDGRFPQTDHTKGTRDGYYMSLSRLGVQRAGDRALLISPEVPGSANAQCLSFWYYLYEPIVDNTGPNLGKLALWSRTNDKNGQLVMTPIWRLQNGEGPGWKYAQAKVESETAFQIIIEGVWGNNRVSGYMAVDDVTFFEGDCSTVPSYASQIRAECTFDRDSCSWRNTSTAGELDWRLATLARRPANLPDKTFGAPVGYAYFDIFNTGARSNRAKLISPTIRKGNDERLCFSFWFAAFGAGESTSLRIYREESDYKKDHEELPKVEENAGEEDAGQKGKQTIWEMSASPLNTARSEWTPGQADVDASTDFRLVLEGKASNGGFAVDQLVFTPGKCSTRPSSAAPASTTSSTTASKK